MSVRDSTTSRTSIRVADMHLSDHGRRLRFYENFSKFLLSDHVEEQIDDGVGVGEDEQVEFDGIGFHWTGQTGRYHVEKQSAQALDAQSDCEFSLPDVGCVRIEHGRSHSLHVSHVGK